MRSADIALSRVKARGVGGVDFFEEKALESVRRRVLIETALRDAIVQDELRLLYQPLFSMDGVIVGAEALLRWDSRSSVRCLRRSSFPSRNEAVRCATSAAGCSAPRVQRGVRWPSDVRLSVNVSVAQLVAAAR